MTAVGGGGTLGHWDHHLRERLAPQPEHRPPAVEPGLPPGEQRAADAAEARTLERMISWRALMLMGAEAARRADAVWRLDAALRRCP